jgi:hypothetical protein
MDNSENAPASTVVINGEMPAIPAPIPIPMLLIDRAVARRAASRHDTVSDDSRGRFMPASGWRRGPREATSVIMPIEAMIRAPTAPTTFGGSNPARKSPDVIAPAVPAIVTPAMSTFGARAIGVPRSPSATPAARLSRFDTAAIKTAESQSTSGP